MMMMMKHEIVCGQRHSVPAYMHPLLVFCFVSLQSFDIIIIIIIINIIIPQIASESASQSTTVKTKRLIDAIAFPRPTNCTVHQPIPMRLAFANS